MIKRLLGFLATKTLIASDDPVVDVSYTQSAEDGVWSASFRLLGSRRVWSTTLRFKEGTEDALDPVLPDGFVRDGSGYATPYVLTPQSPVTITIKSSNLRSITGTVFVSFEANGRIGGTIMTRFIPIGLADPALIERYEESVKRNRERKLGSTGS